MIEQVIQQNEQYKTFLSQISETLEQPWPGEEQRPKVGQPGKINKNLEKSCKRRNEGGCIATATSTSSRL